jgi:hypothetical protein
VTGADTTNGSVRLHVALQEGFSGDRVEVTIGGSPIEFAELSTRNQIGLADEIEVGVPVGSVEVHVAVLNRSLEATSRSAVRTEVWLAVNLVSGVLEFTWSEEPFFYA